MRFSGEFIAFMGFALVAIIGGVLLIKLNKSRAYGRCPYLYLYQHCRYLRAAVGRICRSSTNVDLFRGDYDHHDVWNHVNEARCMKVKNHKRQVGKIFFFS